MAFIMIGFLHSFYNLRMIDFLENPLYSCGQGLGGSPTRRASP